MLRARRTGALVAALLLVGCSALADLNKTPIGFEDLTGWEADDHALAFETFVNSCKSIPKSEVMDRDHWGPICQVTKWIKDPKLFFEQEFQPVLVTEGKEALFTGYYEPELLGSRQKTDRFSVPLYRRPPELPSDRPWLTRGQIMAGALDGRGLEIAWLEDPVEAFFLHVQGSGRIRFEDGSAMRLGFAAKNGHSYRSIGLELVRRGEMTRSQASAQRIKAWVKSNPVQGQEILAHNPSFVFFRELSNLDPDQGPLGAMAVSVTPERSVAVDPKFHPLGAPVWLEKRGGVEFNRLMIAQDVGSAIKGAQRADIYYGSGQAAGEIAGRTKSTGRLVVLIPKGGLAQFMGAP